MKLVKFNLERQTLICIKYTGKSFFVFKIGEYNRGLMSFII